MTVEISEQKKIPVRLFFKKTDKGIGYDGRIVLEASSATIDLNPVHHPLTGGPDTEFIFRFDKFNAKRLRRLAKEFLAIAEKMEWAKLYAVEQAIIQAKIEEGETP